LQEAGGGGVARIIAGGSARFPPLPARGRAGSVPGLSAAGGCPCSVKHLSHLN
jgi:hypothetical protein